MRVAGYVLRDEDRTGAGAPHRHPAGDPFPQLRDDPVALGELADGRALAAGNDQRVDVVELIGPTHITRLGTDAGQDAQVLGEVALETEDADARGLCLATTSRGRQGVRPAGSA